MQKFWNMAVLNDDEAEITLYGDVVSRQPTNFCTGEKIDGDFITPEGFREDLAMVKDVPNLKVRLNSCGGDLYTGIAIHNALKELKSHVTVVVEGIAASAASVIMCAGDEVEVYPGSLIMIHGVSMFLYDWYDLPSLKKVAKGADASEQAVAEIYNRKTGISTDRLREMMLRETWMTGQEAVDKGFADAVLEDAEAEMSMSADHKVLMVNGIRHDAECFRNLPENIPVMIQPSAVDHTKNAAGAAKGKKEEKVMTLEELKEQNPELIEQIETAAVNSAKTNAESAVTAERERLKAIDAIAAAVPDAAMIEEAKYGETRCTAQELAFRVMQQSAAQGAKFLADYEADGAASGANKVKPEPNNGFQPDDRSEEDEVKELIGAYNKIKGGAQ